MMAQVWPPADKCADRSPTAQVYASTRKVITDNYIYRAELGTRSFFPGSLSAQFLSMDHYCSIAHFADFQVRSSLNRSKKEQWFALGKER